VEQGTHLDPRSCRFPRPTGRFTEGASDNVGSGYWTPTLSSGQTTQLTRNNTVTFSVFELYEWHTTQQGTRTKPGDTINLDSLLRTFAFTKGYRAPADRPGGRTAPDHGEDGPGVGEGNPVSDTPSTRWGS
jgi:hypothetical protein